MPALAIETTGLTRRFGAFTAVEGVNLAVPRGSFYGFLGPNGAGKSTTIKCLTGLLRPTSGSMRILDIDPATDEIAVKRAIGVMPEGLALFERLTAFETLAFIGQVHGLDARTTQMRAETLLEVVDLTEAGDALTADYSHGMRKKLSLCAALLPAPKLLFLDEPFEGIDALASRQIKSLLADYVARGGTIFLTSHILEIVERLCDHIGVIFKGRLVSQGTLDDLRHGAAGGATLEELFLGLVGAEAKESPTLDWLST